MRKFLTGIIAICVLAVSAGTAEAAPLHKRAVTNTVNLVGKMCDNISAVIWRNKGSIAIGTTAVAVAANPEPFIQGAVAVVTGTTEKVVQSNTGSSILSYLLLPIILIVAICWLLGYIRFKCKGLLRHWRIIPLVLAVLLLFTGITQAGIQCGVVRPPLWWTDFVGIVLLIFALFLP